jgi:hypothetical protein
VPAPARRAGFGRARACGHGVGARRRRTSRAPLARPRPRAVPPSRKRCGWVRSFTSLACPAASWRAPPARTHAQRVGLPIGTGRRRGAVPLGTRRTVRERGGREIESILDGGAPRGRCPPEAPAVPSFTAFRAVVGHWGSPQRRPGCPAAPCLAAPCPTAPCPAARGAARASTLTHAYWRPRRCGGCCPPLAARGGPCQPASRVAPPQCSASARSMPFALAQCSTQKPCLCARCRRGRRRWLAGPRPVRPARGVSSGKRAKAITWPGHTAVGQRAGWASARAQACRRALGACGRGRW